MPFGDVSDLWSDQVGDESFCVGPDDFDPAAWMGGSWYCGGCGCEFTPPDHATCREAECPECGQILARNGGYVDQRTKVEKKRRYYEDHKDEIAEKMRRYYEDHKDEIAEKMRRYREDHKDEKFGFGRLGIAAGIVPLDLAMDLATEVGSFPYRVVVTEV
jgi:ribosomal protein S27E